VIGLVLGFAARQPLGNMAAGLLLAVTQPIRIGDRITFEDVTGRVDDLTLSYTYIDPGDGDLVVVPNEKLVGGVVYNHSTGDRSAPVTASAWVPRDTDVGRATDADRTRVGDEEAALRERAQRALQSAGLLGSDE
jgi:small-conductance mechanosensitive channel